MRTGAEPAGSLPELVPDAAGSEGVATAGTAEAVTRNEVLAVWPPGSVAVTVVPDAPAGTLRVQLNAPVDAVVSEPFAHAEIVTPSKTRPTVANTEKPVPETVTVVPTGPDEGETEILGTVTTNDAIARCPPTSVAVTSDDEVPRGTAIVHANCPRPVVSREPVAHAETATPSKFSATGLETEKPIPSTRTVAPTGPPPGSTARSGTVTTKLAHALSPPTSVARTVQDDVRAGTVTVQLTVPDAPVVSEPERQLEIRTPSNTSDSSGADTENPVPDTVTVAPTGPWPGATESVGVVTVNEAVALAPLASTARTLVDEVPGGTRSVQLKDPAAFVESEPLVQLAIRTPSNESDSSFDEGENPVPDTVTVAPTGPCPGVTTSPDRPTVNAADALWPPTSVAVTTEDVVPEGTGSVHENAPAADAVSDPLVHAVTTTPSKTSERSGTDGEKPVPETVTEAPTGPRLALRVRASGVTVNAAEVLWPPESVAVTTEEVVPEGTASAQTNAPDAETASEPLVQFATGTPSKSSEVRVVEGVNPPPDTVTGEPTGPWDSLSVRVSPVTANVAEADWPPASVAVTVEPEVPEGTDSVHANVPPAEVVSEPLAHAATETPAKTSAASGVETENPLPVIVTSDPTGPWEALRSSSSGVTVNAALTD